MNVPVKQYEVLRSVNAGAFNMITTLPSTDTTYLDTGLVIGTAYCYIIRATNLAGKTSSSNKICLTPSVVNPPAFTYNRFATVQSNNSILITGYVDPTPSVSYYYLKRAAGSSGVFSNSFIVPKPTGNTITYTDKTVNTQAESYSYKWEAINTCNKAIMTSNTDTTILLKATVALNLGISLTWNNYGSWLGGVDHYEVYRAVDGVWDPSPVGIVPYSSTEGTYTDDVTSVCATSEGKFSYYVVAIEGNGNPYSFKDSSKSNVVTLYEYPKVYAPNAFTPNGDKLNDIFIPIICFINPGAYSLSIYDRWGYPIMQSTNPAEGWDGKKKGHPCEEGIYMYVINCTASNGDNSLVSGTITLIR
jgi:gliding motility-associated-like protein